MTNKTDIKKLLQVLDFNHQEAEIYTALLKQEQNHLKLSRNTGINRTSVYRIVDDLIQKGIIQHATTERGEVLQAVPPGSLERIAKETEAKAERQKLAVKALDNVLMDLSSIDEFTFKTYQGKDSLKQMLWNELKVKGEILIFSHRSTLNTAFGKSFANKFRREIIVRNIKQRALRNIRLKTTSFTELPYESNYDCRFIDQKILKINQEITITPVGVNLYNWDNNSYLGMEVRNKSYALFMKNVFETFWSYGND